MSSISKYECQKIAWRVKALCDGCPEFLTYYDIKDSLLSKSSRLNIYFSNKTTINGSYSQFAYDVEGATLNGVVYPSIDPMVFEVKYPSSDIKGKIVNL